MDNLKKSLQDLKNLYKKTDIKAVHDVYPRAKEKEDVKYILKKDVLWKLFTKHSIDGYIIDSRNEKIIYTILKYFLKDESFNSGGVVMNDASLQKGLFIYGSYGTGKTLLMETIRKVGKDLITNVNCNDAWFSVINTASFVDDYMRSTRDPNTNFSLKSYHKGKLYIDDLGFENKAFNKTELLEDLLFERYRNKSITFVTTNLSPIQITEKYGDRIGDRLQEMFNIIKWEGESFRK